MIAAGTAALATAAVSFFGAGPALASSHREAPLIAGDPTADNTDVYAFVSPDKAQTVTLIANWIPFEEPNGGPNFYPFSPDANYKINIDNDGDAKPDIVYQWKFANHYRNTGTFLYNTGQVTSLHDPDLNFYQTYNLDELDGSGRLVKRLVAGGLVAPSDVGRASMPNYQALRDMANLPTTTGGRSFAGQADDPFFLDLRVFDLLYGADLSERGQDTLDGYNVNSVALQVQRQDVAYKGNPARNPVIGVWSTTERPSQQVRNANGTQSFTGPAVQVSRLGNPLVNEVVIPVGLKDAFNALPPDQDHNVPAAVHAVTNPEVPQLIQKIYGIQAPPTPRNDLVEIFLTGICKTCGPINADLNSLSLNQDVSSITPAEMLRLNMAVPPTSNPNRLGVLAGDYAGYPNGRRLTDDVVDISLQAVEGAATNGIVQPLAEGDKVDANDVAFGSSFPYLALPHDQAVNRSGSGSGSSSSSSGGSTGGFPAVPAGLAGLGVLLSAAGVVALGRGRGRRVAAQA